MDAKEDHELMGRHFNQWAANERTHWISEHDAAYQGFMAAWEQQAQRHMDAEGVALAIRWYLRCNFMSLKEAAERFEVSSAYLSAIQNGEKSPPDWLLEKIGRRRQAVYVNA